MTLLSPSLLVRRLAGRAAALTLALGSLAAVPVRAADPTAADLAPPETLVFLSLTDFNKTRDGLKENVFWRLSQEPEVKAFFAKSLTSIPPIPPAAEEILARVEKLGVRNAFIAVASLDMPPKVVAGFQFSAPVADVEALLGQARDAMLAKNPGKKISEVQHNGKTIRVMEDNPPLVSVVGDGWYFIGTNVDLVKATLDRAAGKLAAGLSADGEWKDCTANLPAKRDTIWWVRMQPVMDKLIEFVASQKPGPQGRASIEAQFREARKVRSIGATTGLEGGKVRDNLYAHAPGMKMPKKELNAKLLGFTAPETLLYLASAFVLPSEDEFKAMDSDGTLSRGLKEMGLEIRDFTQAVDESMCLFADWPAGALYPSPIVVLDVRDATAAKKVLVQLTRKSPNDSEWQAKSEDGVEYRTLVSKTKGGPPISPTIALTPTHLVAGLNQLDVRGAIRRYTSGGSGLGGAPAYKTALGLVPKGDWTLFYLDTRSAFEKLYGLARNFAPYVADEPWAKQYVDLNLLPSTEAIAKYLTPIVLTQRRTAEGGAAESIGPISFSNAIGFTAAIAVVSVQGFQRAAAAAAPKPPKAPPIAKPTPSKPKPTPDEEEKDDDDEDDATPTPPPRGKAPRRDASAGESGSDEGSEKKGGLGSALDRGDLKPGTGAAPPKRPGTSAAPSPGAGSKDSSLGGRLERGDLKPGTGVRPPARGAASPTPAPGGTGGKLDN